MADNTGNSVVRNTIMKMLGKDCTPREVANYSGVIRTAECGTKCFKTLACGIEIEVPALYNFESVELSEGEVCDVFEDGSSTRYQEYTVSTTSKSDPIELELYFRSDRLADLVEWGKSRQMRLVVIDMNNEDRTQVAFWAYNLTAGLNIAESSSSDLTMIPVSLQPTGEIYVYETGEELTECKS